MDSYDSGRVLSMGDRNRWRYTLTGPQGYKEFPGTFKTWGGAGYHSKETTIDVTEPFPFNTPHPFNNERKMTDPLRINGDMSVPPWGIIKCRNFNPANWSEWSYCPASLSFDTAYWRTRALANMNPYRASVNLPLFLFELREFPMMLKQLGRVLKGKTRASDVAGGYLAFHFGWAPLVSDLQKLLGLQKAIEDRKRYFKRLEQHERFRHTIFDGQISDVSTGAYTISSIGSYPPLFTGVKRLKTEMKVWFTVRAYMRGGITLSSPSKPPSNLGRVVTGISMNPSQFWDAIPWTWLIDYFINVGDFIDAQQAVISLGLTNMSLMATIKQTRYMISATAGPGLTALGGVQTTLQKLRYVYANPTPSFSTTPFLTDHSMRILGSLSCARALRAYRQ